MSVIREFCQKCRALREMRVTRATRVVKAKPGGQQKKIEAVILAAKR